MTARARAVRVARSVLGTLPDGREVPAVTLTNARGVEARVIAYGATLQALLLPDAAGERADVTLGYATIEDYLADPHYLGATIGRYANRIARGRFALDGQHYQLPVNNGENALHGGTAGFDKALWAVTGMSAGTTASVRLRHVSHDGDQGYPGTLTVDCIYSLDRHDRLTIDYRATTDRPTIVNLSHHAYWNLAGEGAAAGALGHQLAIPADTYLPTDAGAIPTGERRPVAGTAFDFRAPQVVGDRIRDVSDPQIAIGRGYDHNWIVGDRIAANPRLVAQIYEPASGRGFDLLSNQPGLQFYAGNYFDGTGRGKSGRAYRQGAGLAFEPQLFPNTPNRPSFGSARLAPGETYRNVIVYRFVADRPLSGR